MRSLCLVALLVLSACPGPAGSSVCAGMVTGKVMGTFSVCNEFDQRYRQNLDNFSFAAAYTELPTSFTFNTEWTLKGQPREQGYQHDTAAAVADPVNYRPTTGLSACSITVSKGASRWTARFGAGVASSGKCSLTFSSAVANPQVGNVTTYKMKGNLSAQLDAEGGTMATGVLDVTMDFEG